MNDYYTAQSPRLVKYFDWINKRLRLYYAAEFGEEVADEIIANSPVQFEALLSEIPYIGGMKNLFTPILIASAGMLAISRVLKVRGRTAEEMFVVFHKAIDKMYNRLPKFVMRLFGHLFLSRYGGKRLFQRLAARSQECQYPADWVFQVVEGAGEDYDWGIEYAECAVIKFWEAQDAYDLMPYCNFGDIAMSKALGLGMESATLGEGCEICVARFKFGRETQMREWC